MGWQRSSASTCLQDREYKWEQNVLEGACEGENDTWNNSFALESLLLAKAMHISYLVTQKSQLTCFLVISGSIIVFLHFLPLFRHVFPAVIATLIAFTVH